VLDSAPPDLYEHQVGDQLEPEFGLIGLVPRGFAVQHVARGVPTRPMKQGTHRTRRRAKSGPGAMNQGIHCIWAPRPARFGAMKAAIHRARYARPRAMDQGFHQGIRV